MKKSNLKHITYICGILIATLYSLTINLQIANAQQPSYHTVQFGWSLGPMDGVETYGALLFPSETKYDRGHYRVFIGAGPSIDTNVAYVIGKVKYILEKSQPINKWVTIILTLRDFPYKDMVNHNMNNLTSQQKQVSVYSNRFTPSNIEAYERYLTSLMNELQVKNYLPHIKIELWGEPNAPRYFWGYNGEDITFPAFHNLTDIKYNVIKNYPVEILQADFTSGLQRDSGYKDNSLYWQYANTDSFFLKDVTRSHSFYWNDAGGVFDVNDNNWIDRPGKVTISEYNLFVGIKKGTKNDSIFNSPEWGWKLYEFLKFIYEKKEQNKGTVTEIYFHSLCDYSNKYDDKGKLGLISKLKTPENWTYVLPKKGWTAVRDIHSVIKDGYYPIEGGLQGKTKKIIFDNNKNYLIVN